MAVPVRTDDVIALMLPAWGMLLGHRVGADEIRADSAKHLRPEVRDLYQQLARGGAKVTAEDMKGALEQHLRAQLAPFENRVPTEAELAKLSPLLRERLEDYQQTRREAHLRRLAQDDPFPEGIAERKYVDLHLELKTLELSEKLITDHELLGLATELLRKLKGKREKTLADGTTIRVVNDPQAMFGSMFHGGGAALQISPPDREPLYVQVTGGRMLDLVQGHHHTVYTAESPDEVMVRLGAGRRQNFGKYFELKQKFVLGYPDTEALKQLAVAFDGVKNRGKGGAAIEQQVRGHREHAIAVLGQYMIKAEWPDKLSVIAERLQNGRAMKIDGDRIRLAIKPKVELTVREGDDEKKVTLTEGGPFIHVRDSHGNRDFVISVPALAEGRLELALAGDQRRMEQVQVAKDGTMNQLDLRLPALGNLEAAMLTAWGKIKGIKVDPWAED